MRQRAIATSTPQGKNCTVCRDNRLTDNAATLACVKDCNACPLQALCTTNKQRSSLCRSMDEVDLDRVRAYQLTEAYKKALRKRSVWVEPFLERSARTGWSRRRSCGGALEGKSLLTTR